MAMAMSLDRKVFYETEGVIVRGEYSTPDGPRKLLASREVLEDVDYFPESEVAEVFADASGTLAGKLGERPAAISVVEGDILAVALEVAREHDDPGANPVLVLNFAMAYQAGGGLLVGANSQEGELCRRSTVFASISSREARAFYDANSELAGSLYTDGLLVSPHVEVFRKVGYLTMDAPVVVSVVSMPAPYALGLKDMPQDELFEALKKRVGGMLAVAAQEGYRHLVLGAWGCGSNSNDPVLVAKAFHEALDAPLGPSTFSHLFDTVTFAIIDPPTGQRNLDAFKSEFGAV